MSSAADTEARRVLGDKLLELDASIAWYTDDLMDCRERAIRVDGEIEKLKRQRTALRDALAVHFPAAIR